MKNNAGQRKEEETRAPQDDVRWSKKLSWALRHHAVEIGLTIDSAGFVSVEQLLSHKQFRGLSFDLLQRIVENNAKKRFEILKVSEDLTNLPSHYRIRAAQGHSMGHMDDSLLLEPILSVEDLCVKTKSRHVLHGTYRRSLDSILREGLKSMSRNHIHFTVQLPKKFAHLYAGDVIEEGKVTAEVTECVEVISGMRTDCEVAILINLDAAIRDGIGFFLSSNNVVLTRGEGESGVLPAIYFQQVLILDGGRS